MIKLNCPHCKDPVSAHDDGGCAAEVIVSGGTCPCGMGDVEIMIEMIEKLAKAANDACFLAESIKGVRTKAGEFVYKKLVEALAGIEIVEDQEVPA